MNTDRTNDTDDTELDTELDGSLKYVLDGIESIQQILSYRTNSKKLSEIAEIVQELTQEFDSEKLEHLEKLDQLLKSLEQVLERHKNESHVLFQKFLRLKEVADRIIKLQMKIKQNEITEDDIEIELDELSVLIDRNIKLNSR